MADRYEKFKEKAFSAFRGLARECPEFEDAEMLVGGADATASLLKQDIFKSIDTDWLDAIEQALPSLDYIVRNPGIAIEDVDEVLPVELSRHITEKSIKHLAQHTNFILTVEKNGDVVPQKILNVYHDETLLTYENKFINTLLTRLSAFVDRRYRALTSSSGIERKYDFRYQTEFEHVLPDDGGKNLARIHLNIELTSPLNDESETNLDIKDKYIQALQRLKKINMALITYRSSRFAQALGKNYIRPPVVRTNAILKNKHFKECLTLWEFIESFDKVGYTARIDGEKEMPSSSYVSDLYSSVAFQYTDFYYGVTQRQDNRLLAEKHLFDVSPEFDLEFPEEELEDYQVYDSEYKKTVPVSRLMNNRKKLSPDEKRIHRALLVALKADEILNAEMKAAEAEMRRLARQRRLEEEERRRAEEAERARLAALLAASPIPVRYRRSFLSRYIQSGEVLQGYYGQLKNQLLGYKGVKSRISWKAERFNKGRQTLARMDVRGKRVYVYLALDPKEFEGSKYHFTDVSDKKADTPMLVKIRGSRSLLHAGELIAKVAERYGLKAIERVAEDYSMPYETDEALIGKELIKIVFPKGVTVLDGQPLTKENLQLLFANLERKKPTPVESTPEVPTTEEDPAPEEDRAASVEDTPTEILVRYRRSFLSRYIQSGEVLQGYYGQLKNRLLAYEDVNSHISWKADRFNKGRQTIAKIDVRGKRVYLYLALEPAAFEGSKYRFTDMSGKKTETPMLVKISGSRSLLHAGELIEALAEKYGLTKIERAEENYSMPYETDESLIEKGLIKIIYPKGVAFEEGQILTRENLEEVLQAYETTPVEEAPVEDVPVAELVHEEELAPIEIVARHRRSFLARYIQSGALLQGYYGQLKNQLLGYKGVKSCISWKADRFSKGRQTLARMDIRGKRIYLYLALEPAAFEGSKYRFTDVSDKKADTPMLVKIRGSLGLLHAGQLLAKVAEKYDLTAVERVAEEYAMPYETDEALVEKGLIKIVYTHGSFPSFISRESVAEPTVETVPVIDPSQEEVAVAELVESAREESVAEVDVQSSVAEETDAVALVEESSVAEVPVAEERETPAVEETVEEAPAEEEETEDEESLEEAIPFEDDAEGRYAYFRSLLVDGGLTVSQEGDGEAFTLDGKTLARMERKRKKIYLYLGLDYADMGDGEYHLANMARKFEETPMLLKVRGEKDVALAVALITQLVEEIAQDGAEDK